MAIQEDLSEWEIASTGKMISYAFGYIIINFLLQTGFALVFYFYEVEVGIAVGLLGFAFVIFAIWNMINDPILGFITDRPMKWTKKWGLRAPWVVISAFPILIFYFLIWVPPENASDMTIFLWFIIITCLFDTFFSIYNDHVYGGFTNQFPSEFERRRSFAIATILMGLFMTAMGVIGNLIIVYGDKSSFFRYAMVMVILLVIFNAILFTGIRESEQMKAMFISSFEKAEAKGFIDTLKTALKQRNFAVSLTGYTCQITSMTLVAASGIYMYKDVYKLPYSYAAIPAIIGMIGFVIVVPFWYNYARKHGFKKTYWLCFILHGLSFIPFLFITEYIHVIIFTFISALFYSGEVIMLMPVASDTYDEVSSVMEKRVDATLVGVRNFFFRVAFLAVGIIIPVVHIVTVYDPNPYATQTPLAVWGVRVHAALIPMLIFITMGLIFRKYYTLEGAEKEALVRKLKDLGIYR
ncbi:MAG: MFS transporter [Promethearchaeota archaeon]|nr:MAG: MFS transporter [Candidatus Lokiarchaeota archaeon]